MSISEFRVIISKFRPFCNFWLVVCTVQSFYLTEFVLQVYVSKNGQELSGRDAYKQYKKVKGGNPLWLPGSSAPGCLFDFFEF